MCRRMTISGDLDLHLLAKKANGFVGADLAALCKEAAVITRGLGLRLGPTLAQAQALSLALAQAQALALALALSR